MKFLNVIALDHRWRKNYRKNSSKILKKRPFFDLKFDDFLMSVIRFRAKIIFEKVENFLWNFLLNFDKNDFYAKSFGGFWKLVFCVHTYTCSFYKSVVSNPIRVQEGLFRSEKVSSANSAFSAIAFEKSLKKYFTQFFDIFAKFLRQFSESKNFEESQKVTGKVMLL